VHAPERLHVAVWRIDLSDERYLESVARTHLVERERRRAETATASVGRRRILLRAGLRSSLAALLDVAPADVPLADIDGRPVVVGTHDLHLSCSASGRVGLITVVRGRAVGIDVERHDAGDAQQEALAEGWLSAVEQRLLERLPRRDRPLAVTRCWTQKEAVLKGMGVGLRRSPRTVVTPVSPTGRIEGWAVRPVPVAPGHAASVAVRTSLDEIELDVRDLTVGAGR
jgi:phosphopantetheinyl transferase